MRLNKILKNTLLILTACLVLSACATKKEVSTDAQGQTTDQALSITVEVGINNSGGFC